jgi:hypothetical protein
MTLISLNNLDDMVSSLLWVNGSVELQATGR